MRGYLSSRRRIRSRTEEHSTGAPSRSVRPHPFRPQHRGRRLSGSRAGASDDVVERGLSGSQVRVPTDLDPGGSMSTTTHAAAHIASIVDRYRRQIARTTMS